MPEQEFELYLSLMGRFLKLTPEQRDEISEELRDHLELRLEDLAQQGYSRTDAIRLALDEMGDAGELAQHFSTIARLRRRRFIMRCTLGTAVVLAIGFFFVTAIWPDHPIHEAGLHAEGEPAVVAPQKTVEAVAVPLSKEMKVYQEAYLDEWDALLEKKMELDMKGLSLQDALDIIADNFEITIVIHNSVMDSLGDLSSFEIERNYSSMKLRTLLGILLGAQDINFACQEGVMYIITNEEAMKSPIFLQTRMYDCRELVKQVTAQNHSSLNEKAMTDILRELEQLVTAHIETGRWQIAGGNGGISSFHGLLVVQQTDGVHHKVKRFLSSLRKPYIGVTAGRADSVFMDHTQKEVLVVNEKTGVVFQLKGAPEEQKPTNEKGDEK